jgi:cell division cycle 2-like protein
VLRPHPLLTPCRSLAATYDLVCKLDEGTFGIVWKGTAKASGETVALKQVKVQNNGGDAAGFPMQPLREINVLLALSHENILPVREMVVNNHGGSGTSSTSTVYMVMDFMLCDLNKAVTALPEVMTQGEAKRCVQQLCDAVAYMHAKGYMHRDLKTANILLHQSGKICICDFGLARSYDTPLRKDYTLMVITLWYRPPELLLGATTYGPEVDIWSLGCIFAEMLMLKTLFPGQGEMDQISQIFGMLGKPSEENWTGFEELGLVRQGLSFKGPKVGRLRSAFPSNSFSGKTYLNDSGFGLLRRMLECDPGRRIRGDELLDHEYFKTEPAATDVRWNI